jgi:hypothetical protein
MIIQTGQNESVIDQAVAKALVDYDNFTDKRPSAIFRRVARRVLITTVVVLGIVILAVVSPVALVLAAAFAATALLIPGSIDL